MKKYLLLTLCGFILNFSFGQLTGIKTIPGDYATLQAAISALNTQGVGTGGVTFEIAAGYTETFSSPTSGTISATGTAANPVVFHKSGEGANPLITAGTGNSFRDGIIKFSGSDYITFDGINVTDVVTNNTDTKRMEWGYALVKKNSTAPFDGCDHIVIKNCSVNLSQTYTSTRGIYTGNHIATTTTNLNITALTDAHRNCSFFNNTISNCNQPISLNGFNAPSPYSLYDQNMNVGVEGGNTITGFAGGKGIYTKYQNNLQIANNTITETVGSNTAIYGIHTDVASAAPVKIYNNTISLKNGTTSATSIYGIACASGSAISGTGCSNRIYNNIIQNCTFGFTDATGFYGIEMLSSPDSTYLLNNQIINNILPGNGTFNGISTLNPLVAMITGNTVSGNQKTGAWGNMYCIKAGYSLISFEQNNIFNNSLTAISGTGSAYLVGYHSSQPLSGEVIANNNIYNLSIAGSSTGTIRLEGIYSHAMVDKQMYNNQIHDLTVSDGYVTGIYMPWGSWVHINNNSIYSLTNQNGAAANTEVRGIDVNYFTNLYVYNNFISDLNALSANSLHALAGIYIGNTPGFGQTAHIYYNTVYIKAMSTGTQFGTSALYSGYAGNSTYLNLILQDNILIDLSTPNDIGKAVAFRRGGFNWVSYSDLSDYNNLYAGTPGPNHALYYDGFISLQTIADINLWFTPRELHSFSENTAFINTSVAPYNLHVDAAVPSQCESGGMEINATIAVMNDYDGDARFPVAGYPDSSAFPAIRPDVGADEFAGVHLDIIPPVIEYTALNLTGYTGERTLVATITDDYSGIPVSGIGLPVLYWRTRGASIGAWQPSTGTFVTSGIFQFTLGGTAVDGDTVDYYIVAQDMAPIPNITVTPAADGTGLSANPPACSYVPNPAAYLIASMCGTYYVGSGQDYENLQLALNDLYQKEVICPVTFLLTDSINISMSYDLYTYLGSSHTNTVTIKPAPGVNAMLAAFGRVFTFSGASNYIIDGSNLAGGITSNLYLHDFDGTGTSVISFSGFGNTACINNVIKNVTLIGGGNTYDSYGINVYSQTDSLIIQNNRIWNVVVGIQLNGSFDNSIESCRITGNTIGSLIDTLKVTKRGIDISYTNNTLIQDNLISNMNSTNYFAPIGIEIGYNNTNTQVLKNNLTGIKYGGLYDDSGVGIEINSYILNSNILVANNIISDIAGNGSTQLEYDAIAGIRIIGVTGGISLFHNSVNLFGNIGGYSAGGISSALYIGPDAQNISLQNNIFRNTLNDTIMADALAYGIYAANTASAYTVMDNNCYYTSGLQGKMAKFAGSEYLDIASLSAASGLDNNSLDTDPLFNSPYTLIPSTASPAIGAGFPLPEIPADYLGVARSLTNPTIGAYEYGIGSADKNLLVYLLPEGLYEGMGLLRKASNGSGPAFPALIADKVNIELHDAANYQNLIYSATDVSLSTAGTVSLQIPQTYGGQYYVTVKHRNHIETASALPVSFEFDNITCAFLNPADVFGNNLLQTTDGFYVIYGGDVNQDGTVDGLDMIPVDNQAANFGSGYIPEDVNGDGSVDALDMIVLDNNAAAFVSAILP